MPVKLIKLEFTVYRVLLLLPAVFFVALAFFCVKWGLANTASHRIDPDRVPEFRDVAAALVSMAPDDPQTHYASAVLHERSFLPEDLAVSASEFEKATSLAPYNYLLWLELGRSRERTGDATGGERALRRAKEFAPNYSDVQWALGNNLVRQGKMDEGFAEMRNAVAGDEKYASAAAATAWEFFDGDMARVGQMIGDSSRIHVALVGYLGRQKRFDEAFAIWDSIQPEEKTTLYKQAGTELYGYLLEAKKFRLASQVFSQVLAGDGENAAPGRIANGGFEYPIKPHDAFIFEWHIAEGAQPQISPDTGQKRGGERSLVMILASATGKEFRAVSQTVIVEPGKPYTFDLFYKTELKASSTFNWEIVDAVDGKVLASSEPVNANSDWTSQRVKFNAPASTEAVVIRLARVQCGAAICPINGRIWFDDLGLSGG